MNSSFGQINSGKEENTMKTEDNKNIIKAEQSLVLKDRKYLDMSGIIEVISFNEEKVILQTTQGLLDIKGQDLNIHSLNLDNGNIKIEGLFSSLIYTDKNTEKGILKKLFK